MRRIGFGTAAVLLGAALLVTTAGEEVGAAPARHQVVDVDYTVDESGYWVTWDSGEVEAHGAPHFGHRPALSPDERVASLSPAPSGHGYWLFSDKGRAFAYGDAGHQGDLSQVLIGGVPVSDLLNGPIVGSTPTPTGDGYWMVASDGGIFSFGDAPSSARSATSA